MGKGYEQVRAQKKEMTNTMKTYSTAHKLKKCVSVQKSVKDNSTNIGVGV